MELPIRQVKQMQKGATLVKMKPYKVILILNNTTALVRIQMHKALFYNKSIYSANFKQIIFFASKIMPRRNEKFLH